MASTSYQPQAGMAVLNSAVSACETGAQWQVALQLLTEGAFAAQRV